MSMVATLRSLMLFWRQYAGEPVPKRPVAKGPPVFCEMGCINGRSHPKPVSQPGKTRFWHAGPPLAPSGFSEGSGSCPICLNRTLIGSNICGLRDTCWGTPIRERISYLMKK